MDDVVERWVRVTDEGVQVAAFSALNEEVRVGPATMAMLRGEAGSLVEDKYPDHKGLFVLVSDEKQEDTWSITRQILVELLDGIGFVKLYEELV